MPLKTSLCILKNKSIHCGLHELLHISLIRPGTTNFFQAHWTLLTLPHVIHEAVNEEGSKLLEVEPQIIVVARLLDAERVDCGRLVELCFKLTPTITRY